MELCTRTTISIGKGNWFAFMSINASPINSDTFVVSTHGGSFISYDLRSSDAPAIHSQIT
jgi:hypothetical protein